MSVPRWAFLTYYRLERARIDAIYFAQVGATLALRFVDRALYWCGIDMPMSVHARVLQWIRRWGAE